MESCPGAAGEEEGGAVSVESFPGAAGEEEGGAVSEEGGCEASYSIFQSRVGVAGGSGAGASFGLGEDEVEASSCFGVEDASDGFPSGGVERNRLIVGWVQEGCERGVG